MSSKKVWVLVGVIAAVIAAAVVYVATNKTDMPRYAQPRTSSPQASVEEPSEASTEALPTEGSGTFVDYDATTFAATEGRRLLFFHAAWCPQCRALEQDIKTSGVPVGYTIFKVNYDTETALKKQYGVTLQTTLVEVDENGNEVKTFVAYDDPSLSAVINAFSGH